MKRPQLSDFTDQDYAVWGGLLLSRETSGSWTFWRGLFPSPHGYVDVFASLSVNGHESTMLSFICAGRTYSRSWDRRWGDRTIARLAREFAEEVVSRGVTP